MSTRRQFLAASSAVCALSALPQRLFAQFAPHDLFANGYVAAYTQGLLTQPNFEAVTGSRFTVLLDDGGYTYLTLESVTSLSPATVKSFARVTNTRASLAASQASIPAPQTESFSVQFSVSGAPLSQQTYLLDHGTLGRFSAFLVPSGGSTNTCTAIFNYVAPGTVITNPAAMQGGPIITPSRPITLAPSAGVALPSPVQPVAISSPIVKAPVLVRRGALQ